MELYGDIYSTNLNTMPNVTNFCLKDQKESVSIIHIMSSACQVGFHNDEYNVGTVEPSSMRM